MARHHETGMLGEAIALDYLKNHKYEILETNWRLRKFEIDIIAVDLESGELVILEVKARSTDAFGNPEEAVDEKKQRQLIDGAQEYIEKEDVDRECRFDVIALIIGQEIELSHLQSAFSPQF